MARNSEASQAKILKTAVQVFAKKGFDGARVDEIARKAQVNKALIYYYFKSKAKILEEIFRVFHDEASDLLLEGISDQKTIDDSSEFEGFFDASLMFLEERRDILKIMLTESLKSNDKEAPLFGFLRRVFDQDREKVVSELKKHGMEAGEDLQPFIVTEFFTNIIPIVSYIVFKDKWCRAFNIEPSTLRDLFVEAFKSTHLAYHKAAATNKASP